MPRLAVNGADHYYRLEGRASSAKRIALVHSVGTDLSIWDHLVPDLLATHRILRYDIRGHGGSVPAPGSISLDVLADDLLGLTSSIGWDSFAVAGVSIGAMLACKASILSPGRIEKLLLCSAAARIPVPVEDWNSRIDSVLKNGMTGLVEGMVDRMFSSEYRSTNPPEIDALSEVFARMDPRGYASCLAVLRDADLLPELDLITAPVLMVTGKRDALLGNPTAQPFADRLREFAHVQLDSGHYPLLEAPPDFSRLTTRFLNSAEERTERVAK
ncbi:MAG: alpha/beta fold hydrolase [Burkholderiaceae bacterium]